MSGNHRSGPDTGAAPSHYSGTGPPIRQIHRRFVEIGSSSRPFEPVGDHPVEPGLVQVPGVEQFGEPEDPPPARPDRRCLDGSRRSSAVEWAVVDARPRQLKEPTLGLRDQQGFRGAGCRRRSPPSRAPKPSPLREPPRDGHPAEIQRDCRGPVLRVAHVIDLGGRAVMDPAPLPPLHGDRQVLGPGVVVVVPSTDEGPLLSADRRPPLDPAIARGENPVVGRLGRAEVALERLGRIRPAGTGTRRGSADLRRSAWRPSVCTPRHPARPGSSRPRPANGSAWWRNWSALMTVQGVGDRLPSRYQEKPMAEWSSARGWGYFEGLRRWRRVATP